MLTEDQFPLKIDDWRDFSYMCVNSCIYAYMTLKSIFLKLGQLLL